MEKRWEVNITDECEEWYDALSEEEQGPIDAAVELLQQRGPNLGRPVVGEVAGSKIHNLKELRPSGTSYRILFAFDPRREAILLVGADKASRGWKAWYPPAIAEAERLWDTYIADLKKEGVIKDG